MESKFAQKEAEVLKFWQDKKIFAKTLKKDSPKGDYVFYDGPPFATGTPHYGHIVASLMKDVVPRFWTMRGYHVERKWGWDTHGLPIENLIEQELDLKTKKDIEKIGVETFNQHCRDSVLRYADVWKQFIPRMARWVDMENAYKTLDIDYMESILWVFKTLYDKGLIYEGRKAMHICPRCETTLSNFEVTQGYKDVKDLTAIWKFKLVDEGKTYLLAWTTAPWSTPGTTGLTVDPKFTYVKVKVNDENLIFVKERLDFIMGDIKDYKIVEEFKGKELVGKSYEPIVDSYKDLPEVKNNKNIYRVFAGDYVELTEGTGVVTINGAYGEIDTIAAKENDLPTLMDVDLNGKFNHLAGQYAGMSARGEGEEKLVNDVDKKGLVWRQEKYLHSYPHCWRCDTALLNYSTTSWFVKVTEIKKDLIKNNEKVTWVPAHLKKGRFGKWLEGAQDWAISRQRYWGAPIPVWQCDCGEEKVIGSVKELEKLSGQKVKDLHKHVIDKVTFKCKCGKEMNRVGDVLDCWFESGSMPYAQVHYPFENKDWFEKNFPAEFIAEGVDQTRGWFYTLMVLSTALFNKPAYKHVIANGIVLAESGQKMSKRLQNYPEPDLIVDQYGADALRLYLLTAPVMAAETLNFSEIGVKEALQKNIMLIGNVLSFYQMYQGKKSEIRNQKSDNILDRWILAKLNLLKQEVTEQMEKYNLVRATRPFSDFINQLSTWYLRRSRQRFKQGDQDGINTLGYVLLEFSKIAAPFIPFMAEDIYRQVSQEKESVHLEDWPKVDKGMIDKKLLEEMKLVRQIVEKGLAARSEAGIKVRQPLASYTTSLTSKLDKALIDLVKAELNIKELKFGKTDKLDTKISEDLQLEGIARELIRQINQMRKVQKLTIKDKIIIYQAGFDEVFKNFGEEIKKATIASEVKSTLSGATEEIDKGKIGIEKA